MGRHGEMSGYEGDHDQQR